MFPFCELWSEALIENFMELSIHNNKMLTVRSVHVILCMWLCLPVSLLAPANHRSFCWKKSADLQKFPVGVVNRSCFNIKCLLFVLYGDTTFKWNWFGLHFLGYVHLSYKQTMKIWLKCSQLGVKLNLRTKFYFLIHCYDMVVKKFVYKLDFVFVELRGRLRLNRV